MAATRFLSDYCGAPSGGSYPLHSPPEQTFSPAIARAASFPDCAALRHSAMVLQILTLRTSEPDAVYLRHLICWSGSDAEDFSFAGGATVPELAMRGDAPSKRAITNGFTTRIGQLSQAKFLVTGRFRKHRQHRLRRFPRSRAQCGYHWPEFFSIQR